MGWGGGIKEIGSQHVVQEITDNASNCKLASKIVNETYPHIFGTPCVVHTLNLTLKNICAPSSAPSNKCAVGFQILMMMMWDSSRIL